MLEFLNYLTNLPIRYRLMRDNWQIYTIFERGVIALTPMACFAALVLLPSGLFVSAAMPDRLPEMSILGVIVPKIVLIANVVESAGCWGS